MFECSTHHDDNGINTPMTASHRNKANSNNYLNIKPSTSHSTHSLGTSSIATKVATAADSLKLVQQVVSPSAMLLING